MTPAEMIQAARDKAFDLGDKAWHEGSGGTRVFCAVCGDAPIRRYVSVDTGKRLPSRHKTCHKIHEIRNRVCANCIEGRR